MNWYAVFILIIQFILNIVLSLMHFSQRKQLKIYAAKINFLLEINKPIVIERIQAYKKIMYSIDMCMKSISTLERCALENNKQGYSYINNNRVDRFNNVLDLTIISELDNFRNAKDELNTFIKPNIAKLVLKFEEDFSSYIKSIKADISNTTKYTDVKSQYYIDVKSSRDMVLKSIHEYHDSFDTLGD